MKKVIIGSLFMILLISSCEKDKGLWYSKDWEKEHPNGQNSGPSTFSGCSDTMGIVMSYSTDIVPILQSNCSLSNHSCHSPTGSGGDLTTYANVAGWCGGSSPVIMGDITWQTNAMPKNASKLPDCTIAKISKWIKNGYPNN